MLYCGYLVTNSRTTWEPMKPAPPVTIIVLSMILKIINDLNCFCTSQTFFSGLLRQIYKDRNSKESLLSRYLRGYVLHHPFFPDRVQAPGSWKPLVLMH